MKHTSRRKKSLRDQIVVGIVVFVMFFTPATLIMNFISFHKVSELTAEIRQSNQNQQKLEQQLEKQAAAHKNLNDTVYNMSLKVNQVEKTYQYVNRGGIDRAVPSIDTSAKTYMDYRCISAGKQYDLQQGAWTDDQGFRRYGNDYMVAMGSYYGDVGDRFEITLSSGKVFTVIKGDAKSDRDTDALHMHRNGNVIEFIVDDNKIGEESRSRGDMSYSGFEGSIKNIRGIK